ncbi:MAG: TolC family protein [Opitutaceae bacterium]|nr:TolC family protein [Opitutaceae bacterium]
MLRITFGLGVAEAFLIIVSSTPVSAESPSALLPDEYLPELRTLLTQAVNQSPPTLRASLEVARARAQELVDSSAMWPTLSADIRWAAVESSIAGTSTQKNRNAGLFYTLSLYQPVFHWGALKAQSDIGKIETDIAEKRFEDTYRTLALTIRSQYLDLIQRKKGWNYSKFTLQQTEARFQALQQRRDAGAISAAELNEPRLKLAEARIAADRMEESFVQGCRTLAALCGVQTISADQVPDEFPKPEITEEQLQALYRLADSFDPGRTPQGAIYEMTMKQNRLSYRIARSRTLPKVGLSASASQQNSTTAFGGGITQSDVTQQMVGVAANWTIFDGFAARGQKLALLQQRRQLNNTISEYDRAQREKIDALRKQIGFAVRSLEISETRLNISNNSVAVVAAEVKSGHSSPDGLETVQSTARTTELTTLTYRTDFFAKVAEYLSTLGVDPALSAFEQRK